MDARGESEKKSELWEHGGVAFAAEQESRRGLFAIITTFCGNFPDTMLCGAQASCVGKSGVAARLRNRLLHYLHLLNATNRCSITSPNDRHKSPHCIAKAY